MDSHSRRMEDFGHRKMQIASTSKTNILLHFTSGDRLHVLRGVEDDDTFNKVNQAPFYHEFCIGQ